MGSSVALIGGGLRGAVAAARYATGDELVLLHVNVGQRCWPAEAKAVGALARSFPSAQVVSLDLPHLSQLEYQIGEEGGEDSRAPSPATLTGSMPVLLSMGVQCAMRFGASRVVVGLSRLIGSSCVGLPLDEGQPRRLRELVHSFNLMVEALLGQRSSVRVEAPLMDTNYAEVVRLAFHFKLPLGELWTCEGSGPRACGRCERCMARARAFAEARLVDPLTAPRPAMAALGE